MREEKPPEDVDTQLELEPLGRLGPLGGDHDARVVPEDVEMFLLLQELLGGLLDGAEVAEV